MKQQVLTQRSGMLIFTVLFFIYGINAMSYARRVEFVEGDTTTREIAENTPANTNIGEPLRYSTDLPDECIGVSFSGPNWRAFDVSRVSPGNLQLKTKSALNYEKKNAYEVRVRVLDWGSPATDIIIVNITVTDVNEAPVFASESTNRFVFEDTAADQNIGTPVSATDPDGDILTYNLSGIDTASFSIDPSSGQLKTKVPLDYETKTQYLVTVETSDEESRTDTINVTINVTTLDRPEALIYASQNGVEVSDQTVTINPFKLIVDFDEPVTGFEQSDLRFDDSETGSTITGWEMRTDGKQYTATVAPTSSGGVTFTVPENVAQAADDGQGNVSTTLLVLVVDAPSSPAAVGSKSTPNPGETLLFANYPNPFNPETWIPYHLAKATNVQISIYNAHGTLIQHLRLGHQSAGYYTSRSRAAYWDGKNDLGERVANGIYFYQLQADTVSPLRKMVILK